MVDDEEDKYTSPDQDHAAKVDVSPVILALFQQISQTLTIPRDLPIRDSIEDNKKVEESEG